MKTLILGEILNGTLSSGTLEIIKKAQDESLDYQVVTIGSDDDPTTVSYTHLTLPTRTVV